MIAHPCQGVQLPLLAIQSIVFRPPRSYIIRGEGGAQEPPRLHSEDLGGANESYNKSDLIDSKAIGEPPSDSKIADSTAKSNLRQAGPAAQNQPGHKAWPAEFCCRCFNFPLAPETFTAASGRHQQTSAPTRFGAIRNPESNVTLATCRHAEPESFRKIVILRHRQKVTWLPGLANLQQFQV